MRDFGKNMISSPEGKGKKEKKEGFRLNLSGRAPEYKTQEMFRMADRGDSGVKEFIFKKT